MTLMMMLFLCCVSAATAQRPANVRLDPVREETLERQREVTGELVASRRSRLAAQHAGLILELGVEIGDMVEAGDVIARLDDTLARLEVVRRRAEVRSRRAEIAERESELSLAERDLSIYGGLQGSGDATANELDNARTAVESAQARLERAQAELEITEAELRLAEEQLEDHVVRAPFTGEVVGKSTEVGEWIGAGDGIVDLIATQVLDAIIDVPEAYIDRLRDGRSEVTLRIAALDREIRTPITAIVGAGDELSRTFPVRIRLENEDRSLKPGMSLIGLAPTGRMSAMMTVHKDAIMRNEVGPFVYFAESGKGMMAPVRVLFTTGDRVVISSGMLSPGMQVVTEGNEYLYPGQPLAPIGAASGPGGGSGGESGGGSDGSSGGEGN